ncbi:MAG: lactonase family protein [Stellaceae bacterium]
MMIRAKLTRRRMLAVGLVAAALPKPVAGWRRALADTTPDTVVYVSNAGSKEIGIFAMNRDSGELTAIDKVPVPGTDKPSPANMPMAVTPDRRFIFAALRSGNFPASSFAIDRATGRLTHVATTPLADSMAYIITDRTGRFLLGASYPGNKLTINPIDIDGHIVEKTTEIIPNRPKSHCILVDKTNKYCYASSLGGDIVMEWKFDPASGTLSPNGPGAVHTKPGAGPRHMALHPNQRFLYLITETTDTIGAYAIDPASGTLTELQFVDARPPGFTAQPAAADLHLTPDGRFLYGSERKTSTLAGYRIDPEKGTLSPIGHWPTEKTPRGFNIDPRGRFLLSVGLDSNAMTVYRIDRQSGQLAPVKQYPMGQMPNWIEFVDLR